MSQPSHMREKNSLCHCDLSRHLTSCLRFCRSHSMRINLFCYPCLFILSVKLLMLFNFIYYLKSSNFKSSILQHSLLPYLQTESNVKSPWQQLSGVWEIIGFIASFIIHSKINNFHYISLMYYQTLCKKGPAHLAENYKKLKPDLFRNLQCGHGLCSISMSGVAILIVYNGLELCSCLHGVHRAEVCACAY